MDAPRDDSDDAQVERVLTGDDLPPGSQPDQGAFDEHLDGSLDAAALHQLLLATQTVQEFLDRLVGRAAADTGHHCGITVGPPDAAEGAYTVASSHELSRQLDELQYADGDGPCLEALRTAVPVFVTDMTTDKRWPDYLRHAVDTGARSSMSYPLLSDGRSIGAINFYAFEPLAPRIDLQARASDLAAVAAGALALAMRLAQRGDMIAHLRTALTSRSTIDQAIGILMAQQRCGSRAAFDLLRKASQGRNVKLREVAVGILASVERDGRGAAPGRY
jgi:GAF domain-containing protein